MKIKNISTNNCIMHTVKFDHVPKTYTLVWFDGKYYFGKMEILEALSFVEDLEETVGYLLEHQLETQDKIVEEDPDRFESLEEFIDWYYGEQHVIDCMLWKTEED